jgi:hypothetical protein
MARFLKGNPGKPKGAIGRATREIRAFARETLESAPYVESLRRRLIRGTAPHMETLLHHYAYGKPPDKVEVTGEDGQPMGLRIVFGGRFKPEDAGGS